MTDHRNTWLRFVEHNMPLLSQGIYIFFLTQGITVRNWGCRFSYSKHLKRRKVKSRGGIIFGIAMKSTVGCGQGVQLQNHPWSLITYYSSEPSSFHPGPVTLHLAFLCCGTFMPGCLPSSYLLNAIVLCCTETTEPLLPLPMLQKFSSPRANLHFWPSLFFHD